MTLEPANRDRKLIHRQLYLLCPKKSLFSTELIIAPASQERPVPEASWIPRAFKRECFSDLVWRKEDGRSYDAARMSIKLYHQHANEDLYSKQSALVSHSFREKVRPVHVPDTRNVTLQKRFQAHNARDLNADNLELPRTRDNLDGFIDDDDEEDGVDKEEQERRRMERRRIKTERREALGSRPELTEIATNAWAAIHEAFEDGHDNHWALGDEDQGFRDDQPKGDELPRCEYPVFELSEDVPERTELASSTLSLSTTLSVQQPLLEGDLDEAAPTSISSKNWSTPSLYITSPTRYIFIKTCVRTRIDLLNQEELWHVYSLGEKFCLLLERHRALQSMLPSRTSTYDIAKNNLVSKLAQVFGIKAH
ncbi:hypothetical protein OF83DRAFT_1179266 [Amylostereum chailletii]|nr:hypothetical protein OF83DRAFT_1179266 [Amylostereum chailletii]